MPRAVGLDIGSRNLKLVELSGSAKAFKVTRMFIRPVPRSEGEGAAEQDAAALSAMVQDLFREARLPKDDVCASFDAGTTIFREVAVPFHETDQIEKVVRYEAENHLHGRAIEDVIVNWVKTGDTKEGSQLIVMAAPKAELAADLAILQAAGIEPASVDLDATALFTACHAAGVFVEHPSVIVIEIGARTTNLLLVDGGALKAIRCFLVGADQVTAGLRQDLSLPAGEAEKRALAAGGPDAGALILPASDALPATRETGKGVAELERDAALSRREELVRKLHREVTRSYASAHLVEQPQRILLAGGGSLLPGIAEALKEKFEVDVEPLRILTRIGCPPTSEDAEFQEAVAPSAVGCALRLLGADPLGVELRREEFAPSNLFDVVRGALATAVTLLVAVLLAVVLVTKDRLSAEQNAFHNSIGVQARKVYREAEKKYLEQVKGYNADKAKTASLAADNALLKDHNDATLLTTIQGLLVKRHRELENNLGLSKEIPKIHSAAKAWVEIYRALSPPSVKREDLGWFRVNKMNITQSTASITVEAEEMANFDKVYGALARSEYLKGRARDPGSVVQRGNITQLQNKRYTVSFDIPFAETAR